MTFRMFPPWVAFGVLLCIPLEAASTAFASAFQTLPQTHRAGQAKKPSTAQDSAQKAPANAQQSREEILINDSVRNYHIVLCWAMMLIGCTRLQELTPIRGEVLALHVAYSSWVRRSYLKIDCQEIKNGLMAGS